MSRFSNLKIASKLIILVSVFLLGFSIFGLYSYSSMNTVKVNGPIYTRITQGKDLIADILPPPEYIIESYLNTLQMIDAADAGADQATLTKLADKAKQLRDEYEERHAFWLKELPEEQLKQTLLKSSYDPAIEFYDARDKDFIPAILAGNLDKAKTVARTVLQPKYEAHRASIDQVVKMAEERNMQGEEEAAAAISQALILLIVLGLGAATVSAVLSIGISRSITAPLGKTARVATGVAEGKLDVMTSRVDLAQRDEVGQMANAFNRMIERLAEMLKKEQQEREYQQSTIARYVEYMNQVGQGNLAARLTLNGNGRGANDPLLVLGQNLNETTASLRDMIRGMTEAANNLSSAAAEILSATTQQASGATEQSAAISQTTTTVDEVKTISEQAIVRAQEVANASQRTVDVSRSGQKSVQDTIESMAQIKERVEGIAENILALSEQTQQIGEIIASVNEIAAQSNMLALNASVEAARAGEHGKGFAVVAVEVRNLAEQSRQATAQVKAILSEIQKATNMTVMATEEGTKGVEKGVQLANSAQEAIQQLASVINESAQVAQQVVAGGQQQAAGIEQVALAMQNINQATVQSLASTRQAERAAQNLNELARKLTDNIAQYRL